jgi:hypothetical protein
MEPGVHPVMTAKVGGDEELLFTAGTPPSRCRRSSRSPHPPCSPLTAHLPSASLTMAAAPLLSTRSAPLHLAASLHPTMLRPSPSHRARLHPQPPHRRSQAARRPALFPHHRAQLSTLAAAITDAWPNRLAARAASPPTTTPLPHPLPSSLSLCFLARRWTNRMTDEMPMGNRCLIPFPVGPHVSSTGPPLPLPFSSMDLVRMNTREAESWFIDRCTQSTAQYSQLA